MNSIEKNRAHEKVVLRPGDDLGDWDQFVESSPQGSLFCKSWWLTASCGENFNILAIMRDGRIIAGLPLPFRKTFGGTMIKPPALSSSMGILLRPIEGAGRREKKLTWEIETVQALVEGIPEAREFEIACHPSFINWLPFYWNGYRQTTHYTYVIEDICRPERVFEEFNYSKKKNIKKALSKVSVQADMPPDDFYSHHVMTLKKQGKIISYSRRYFKELYETCYKKNSGKTLYAAAQDGRVHAAIFFVFDSKSAYYLLSSIDPDFRDSGASSLLIFEAIKHVSAYTNRFDFEGSMIKGVENSFRKFGAALVPYFRIMKGSSTGTKMQTLLERMLRKHGLRE